jgi:AcrR family transcriptional regulator
MNNDINQGRTGFSREKWLETALETLSDVCKNKFNLDTLIRAMPVTKGSFYSHFKGREDFLIALVDFWDRHYTKNIIDALVTLPEDTAPEEVLWQLQISIKELQLNCFELLIRSLTLEIPALKEVVKKVDEERFAFVSTYFANLGFEGDDLEMRTQMFVTVMSQEDNLLLDKSDRDIVKQMKLRHELLIRP